MQTTSLEITSHQLVQSMAEYRHLQTKFSQFSAQACRSLGIQPRQYELLLQIAGAPNETTMTVAYAAVRLGLKHNSAVELIDRTEREGFLCREEDPEDRRCTVLQLTERGKDALKRLNEWHAHQLTTLAASITELLDQIEESVVSRS